MAALRMTSTTLLPRLERAADLGHGVTFLAEGAGVRVSWAEVHDDARGMAAVLQARGIGPRHHVALLGRTGRELVTAIRAVWLAGAAVIVLPLPLRLGSLEDLVVQTRARIRQGDTALLLVDPSMAGLVQPEPGDPQTLPLPDLWAARLAPDRYEAPRVDPAGLAILQFTSGSTAAPKGVMMPHSGICANLDDVLGVCGITPEDIFVSWLPLYHDMGLIGLLGASMTIGAEAVLAPPNEFLSRPAGWAEWIASYRGTVTASPNFGYALAARAMRRLDGIDLSSLRMAFNGAEQVDPRVVEAYLEAGARLGLSPRSMFPGYGLAEATLAVSVPEPGSGLRTDTVNARALENERVARPSRGANARRLVRLGAPLPRMRVRIVDPATGHERPERGVGEIEIAGPSVTPGYYRRPDVTAEAFHDGWLRTGDLGYMAEGDLVVCGRIKDLIIVGGRNVHPQDVEWAVGEVAGVRAGNVAAFGVERRPGHERVVVVAETRGEADAALRLAVADRVRGAVGLSPADVVLVPPGTLPKTSSGKLQRSLTRQRYLAGEIAATS